jgi:hypothetical protein
MTAPVARADVDRFYRAAVLGLAVLESRTGVARRFGPDADARWKAFRGGLHDWDRIDLLVRDAAVRHPAGFAPRVVFDLPALADDEPCGPDWSGPAPTEATELMRLSAASPGGLREALTAAAAAWDIAPRPLAGAGLEGVQPTTRLLLAGAGAVVSVAAAFAGSGELDLGDQALLVADEPGVRQLFGLALAGLGSTLPARLVRAGATPVQVHGLGVEAVDRILTSDDVAPAVRDRVLDLGRALGGRS